MSDKFKLLTDNERATIKALYRFKLQEIIKAVTLDNVDAFSTILFGMHMLKARLWIDSLLKEKHGNAESDDVFILQSLRLADAQGDWQIALDSFGKYTPDEDEEYSEACEQCDIRGKCIIYTAHYRGIDENAGPEPDELPDSIKRLIKTLDFSQLEPGD